MRTIVVGDVHGCRAELEALLERLRFDPAADRLVLVGDLVAKGPDSKGVVALCRQLGALTVRGNHDEHVLRWRRAHRRKRPLPKLKKTHIEVALSLDEEDWAYLEALPLYRRFEDALEGRDVLVVHGGFVPGVDLADQEPKYLMNLRSIDEGEPSKGAFAGEPWASIWPGPELVIFGHDAIRGLQRHPHAIGLDTGCVYGGQLSAAVLEGGRVEILHVPAAQTYHPV
jgi:predicted phosphodiesterase